MLARLNYAFPPPLTCTFVAGTEPWTTCGALIFGAAGPKIIRLPLTPRDSSQRRAAGPPDRRQLRCHRIAQQSLAGVGHRQIRRTPATRPGPPTPRSDPKSPQSCAAGRPPPCAACGSPPVPQSTGRPLGQRRRACLTQFRSVSGDPSPTSPATSGILRPRSITSAIARRRSSGEYFDGRATTAVSFSATRRPRNRDCTEPGVAHGHYRRKPSGLQRCGAADFASRTASIVGSHS